MTTAQNIPSDADMVREALQNTYGYTPEAFAALDRMEADAARLRAALDKHHGPPRPTMGPDPTTCPICKLPLGEHERRALRGEAPSGAEANELAEENARLRAFLRDARFASARDRAKADELVRGEAPSDAEDGS